MVFNEKGKDLIIGELKEAFDILQVNITPEKFYDDSFKDNPYVRFYFKSTNDKNETMETFSRIFRYDNDEFNFIKKTDTLYFVEFYYHGKYEILEIEEAEVIKKEFEDKLKEVNDVLKKNEK